MDWLDIGKKIIGLGLPVLGTALGGPLGGSIGAIIAKTLGVPENPEAVNNAIETSDNDVIIQKLKSAEGEYLGYVQAQAALGKVASVAVGETMRAELTADFPGWWGAFQRGWRPIFAYELIIECTMGAFLLVHEAWQGDFKTLSALLEFQGFLTWYYGLRFGVLGVFGIGRSQEKVAAIKTAGDVTASATNGGSVGGLAGRIARKVADHLDSGG